MELRLVTGPDGGLRVAEDNAYRATGTPSNLAPMYGQNGLFGICGDHPTLINACVNPQGFEAVIPWRGSVTESPQYSALTYVGTSGFAQSGLCDDCGKPTLRRCTQTACFGRICQQTNEHAFDQIGTIMNDGVGRKVMWGNITDPSGRVLLGKGQVLYDRFTTELIAAAYNLRRQVGNVLWSGNPGNNLGGYMEHPGFALLIATGKTDSNTGAACAGLDSWIANYNSNIVGALGSPSIVRAITGCQRTVNHRILAAGYSLEGSQTYIAMSPQHWDSVGDAWACEYGLVCPNTTAAAPPRNDAMALADYRDELMRTKQLKIDGKGYPVVVDTGIPLTLGNFGNATTYCGDIYGITTIVDGEQTVWGEYQNFEESARETLAWFRSTFGLQPITVTDGGRFAHAPTTSGGFCFDGRVLTKPRLRVQLPFVCWRLRNVCVVPEGFYADVTGSGGIYQKDGGALSATYLGLYGECA
jgi:hypothetical protein